MSEEVIRIKTTDDWYPNFENNEVEVSKIKLHGGDNQYRICVWGADDFGMEYDTNDKEKWESLFNIIKGMKIIKIRDLEKLNFIRA